MIELRWLIKSVPRPRGIDDGFYNPPLADFVSFPVLQYREGYDVYSEDLRRNMFEWGDWQDVPTVSPADETQRKPDAT